MFGSLERYHSERYRIPHTLLGMYGRYPEDWMTFYILMNTTLMPHLLSAFVQWEDYVREQIAGDEELEKLLDNLGTATNFNDGPLNMVYYHSTLPMDEINGLRDWVAVADKYEIVDVRAKVREGISQGDHRFYAKLKMPEIEWNRDELYGSFTEWSFHLLHWHLWWFTPKGEFAENPKSIPFATEIGEKERSIFPPNRNVTGLPMSIDVGEFSLEKFFDGFYLPSFVRQPEYIGVFWDHFAKSGIEMDEDLREQVMKGLYDLLPERLGKVLDLASGAGASMDYIDSSRAEMVGLDYSRWMCLKAKERREEVLQADAVKLPLIDNSFDKVIMLFGFHWIYDIPEMLTEVRRVLRKYGRFIFNIRRPDDDWQEDITALLLKIGYDDVKTFEKKIIRENGEEYIAAYVVAKVDK